MITPTANKHTFNQLLQNRADRYLITEMLIKF